MRIYNNFIIPYCIYNYIDNDTGNYMGYIGEPKILDKGVERYKCVPETHKVHKWFLYSIFNAIIPNFRPIPSGYKTFFCVENTKKIHSILQK